VWHEPGLHWGGGVLVRRLLGEKEARGWFEVVCVERVWEWKKKRKTVGKSQGGQKRKVTRWGAGGGCGVRSRRGGVTAGQACRGNGEFSIGVWGNGKGRMTETLLEMRRQMCLRGSPIKKG